MIISTPFLPSQAANQSDDAWLDAALVLPPSRLLNTGAPEGSFPLSNKLEWHNGLHLQGQTGADGHTVVRGIADGEAIHVSAPRQSNTDVTDAQNFNPFGDGATWTDNGCVIVKHTTEIGATGQQSTEIVFYSLYMHLNQIARITPAGQTASRPMQRGDRVWRKDEIGQAGQIYGHAGQVHLEICMDEANLTHLIGRAPAWVDTANIPAPSVDGRTDAVFGSLWFYLPANTPTLAAEPASHLRGGSPNQTTLGQAIWVKMTYQSGACTFESFDNTGRFIGALPQQPNVEYNLYNTANNRHNALPQTERAHSSPSGWYELLRFGRNLGRGPAATEKDPLPTNAAHWRRIPGVDGQPVWADLNADGSYKFSDADFLPIQGWNFINDDSTPNDQRCDSPNLKNLIADTDTNNARRMEIAELARRLGDPTIASILRRMVCQFSSEWDQSTITARYSFVQELDEFKANPEAWTTQEAHLRAISFPVLPPEYTAANWRFHPREFIQTMRMCGWLSVNELAQCIPRSAVEQTRASNGSTVYPQSTVTWNTARSRASAYSIDLNITFRKYGVSTAKVRMAYFLANSIQETIYFSRKSELGGQGTRYAPWYGRGFLQLTWEENYRRYGDFRGWQNQTTASYRDTLETDNFCAVDSAGYYWVTCAKPDNSVFNISREGDNIPIIQSQTLANVCQNYSYQSRSCTGATIAINYYPSVQSERVARAINTGNPSSTGTVNGLIPRNNVLANTVNVLLELSLLDVLKQRP